MWRTYGSAVLHIHLLGWDFCGGLACRVARVNGSDAVGLLQEAY